jgi:hypothetical protein
MRNETAENIANSICDAYLAISEAKTLLREARVQLRDAHKELGAAPSGVAAEARSLLAARGVRARKPLLELTRLAGQREIARHAQSDPSEQITGER